MGKSCNFVPVISLKKIYAAILVIRFIPVHTLFPVLGR